MIFMESIKTGLKQKAYLGNQNSDTDGRSPYKKSP